MNEDTLVTIKRIGMLAILLLTAAIVISVAEKKKSKDAKDVFITVEALQDGNSFISREDILLNIERSFGHVLAGLPIGLLDVERVERVLEADPFVKEADVYINALNEVQITVRQRVPIIRVIDRSGLSYYLDADGRQMPMSKHFTARVLVASGNIPPYVPDFMEQEGHLLKDMFLLTQDILNDDLLQPLVEQIYVNDQNDFLLIPKIGRQKIIIGPYERMADKIFKLKTFYKEALPYSGWQKYRSINLKYKNQIIAKKS